MKATMWTMWLLMIIGGLGLPVFLLIGMILTSNRSANHGSDVIIGLGLVYVMYAVGSTVFTSPPWKIIHDKPEAKEKTP